MKLYAAIDLHSTNNVTVVIDEQDRVVYQKRLPNDLALILKELSVYQSELQGIVVESTYNWYWRVDGRLPVTVSPPHIDWFDHRFLAFTMLAQRLLILQPGHSLISPKLTLSVGSSISITLHAATQARRPLALAATGLPSLNESHPMDHDSDSSGHTNKVCLTPNVSTPNVSNGNLSITHSEVKSGGASSAKLTLTALWARVKKGRYAKQEATDVKSSPRLFVRIIN